MKKHIIITGGLGFIGSHLIEKLVEQKYYPIIVDDFSNVDLNNLKNFSKRKFYILKNGINETDLLIKKLAKYTATTIIHLAAIHYIPYCVKNPKKVLEINVRGTRSILEISKNIGIKKIIFASSAAIYRPKKNPHRENDELKPVDIYGKSKLEAEKLIQESKINYTILRLFNVYGDGDLTPHLIPSLLQRILNSNEIKIGNIDTLRDYIYIDDVVNAIIKVLILPSIVSNKIYNIGTGMGYSGKDILNEIEKILSKKNTIVKDKNLIRKKDRKVLIADIKKINRDLSWMPKIPFNQGIKELLKSLL